jgi:signal transduction histidine kinase
MPSTTLIFPWWGSRVWRSLAHVSLDWLVGTVTASIVAILFSLAVGVAPTVVALIPFGWLLFAGSAWLGGCERSRIASLLDLDLPDPHPRLVATGRFARLWEQTRTPSRWTEMLYLGIVLPFLAVPGAIAVALWAGAVAMLALPAYVGSLADGRAHFYFFVVTSGVGVWLAAGAGLIGLLYIAPLATLAAAGLDRAVARRMLGPSSRVALVEQVRVTETRRAAAVESADAQRRRIERDLHDGAQQRLVALAMDLGRARETFDADPERARGLIAEAHDEAKAALSELRDLVRGVHPAILTDRGLDAALSAVVARSAVPVHLTVDVPRRPPPEVESAAYFVVSEALTNVARHAGATRVAVTVVRAAGRLIVEVTDDGVGGASLGGGDSIGTGLVGLAGRVESLGGRLQIVSPPGGPTTVLGELPC